MGSDGLVGWRVGGLVVATHRQAAASSLFLCVGVLGPHACLATACRGLGACAGPKRRLERSLRWMNQGCVCWGWIGMGMEGGPA